MKNAVLSILLWAVGIGISHGYPFRPGIDVLHYRFEIELNDQNDALNANAEVTVLFTKRLQRFTLDLVNRGRKGLGMSVIGVTHKGQSVTFDHSDDQLVIDLLRPSRPGEQRTYRISYTGAPADGLGIGKNRFGDRAFFASNWPNRARHWLPTVDHPSDKASCEFVVIAPNHYQVLANGVKVEQTNLPDQRLLTHWRTQELLPTKVMAIGVTRFAVKTLDDHDPVTVTSWAFTPNRLKGFASFAVTPRILDYFHQRIGPYPYQKLANAESQHRYGGLENASAIFYAERFATELSPYEQEKVIAHEVAHQWFGNAVSEADWPHLWLSEGFATYFENRYMMHAYGASAFAGIMASERQDVIDFSYEEPTLPVIDTISTDINDQINANSYKKGSWVLHMLQHKIGEEVFWQAIREYYHKYCSGNATTADFRAVVENVAGEDLKPFFDQWLRRSGHPVLSTSWHYGDATQSLRVTVTQHQPIPFSAPLDIKITGRGGVTAVHTVQLNDGIDIFDLPVSFTPTSLQLDPSVYLLFEQKK